MLLLSKLFQKQNQSKDHNCREQGCKKQTCFEVAANGICNSANYRGANRRAKIACQCQKGKHCRAAARAFLRGNANRSGPHNANRESAKRAADKTDHRDGGESRQQIAHHAQRAASKHYFGQIQLFAKLSVKYTGNAHKNGKHTGTC